MRPHLTFRARLSRAPWMGKICNLRGLTRAVPPNDGGDLAQMLRQKKKNEAVCLLRDQMAANLACESNEAVRKLGHRDVRILHS